MGTSNLEKWYKVGRNDKSSCKGEQQRRERTVEAVGTDKGEGNSLRDSRGPWWLSVHENLVMLWEDPVCLLGAQCPGCSSKLSVKPNRSEGFLHCSALLPLSTFQIFLSASCRRMCCWPAKGMATGYKQDSYLKSRGSKESPLLHVSHQDHSSMTSAAAPASPRLLPNSLPTRAKKTNLPMPEN